VVNKGIVMRTPEDRYARQIGRINHIAKLMVFKVCEKDQHYGSSWRSRGGAGAFFTIARKWDRLEAAVSADKFSGQDVVPYDLFERFSVDSRGESMVNDCLDLMGYLLVLLEHMIELGHITVEQVEKELATDDAENLLELLQRSEDINSLGKRSRRKPGFDDDEEYVGKED